MSKYDNIMACLNPKHFIEKTEIPHDTTRGKFRLSLI